MASVNYSADWLGARGTVSAITGAPLSEEQLEHGFDLFYSQDKSRSSKDGKHMGLGLYLAKKILDKHGLKITLENTVTGVQVMISGEFYEKIQNEYENHT